MTAASRLLTDGVLTANSLTLPPFGAVTNGLAATSWVPLVELPVADADALLAVLAGRKVAACRRLPRRPAIRSQTALVWVDVAGHALAEDLARALVTCSQGRR